MNTKKNPISEQIKTYYEEMVKARRYCQNVMKVLEEENCLVRAEVGILIKDMPNFTFLKHQGDFLRGLLRKVCSTEISTTEAYETTRIVYLQILDAMSLINNHKFD